MEVLRATKDDIPWLASELRKFELSLGAKHSYIPPTEELLHQELQALLTDHVLLVAWERGVRMGTIGGMRTFHPYNPHVSVLLERFWWVPEEHRGSRAGYMLLREFSNIGLSSDLVVMTVLPDTPAGAAKLLDRLGYRLGEQTFIMEN